MPLEYSPASRALQDHFDTRRLADRLPEVKVHSEFTADDQPFIERLDMFFLATVDEAGQPTCSYKGGDPGFVRVTGPRELAFPNGTASINFEDPLQADFPEAQFVVRVAALGIYPNCPRYIHKYQLVERSRFVPRAAAETPIPGWKQTDWARDVLPAHDPARPRHEEQVDAEQLQRLEPESECSEQEDR